MKEQTDFWKPAPYDFEAIVAEVDVSKLTPAHVYRALVGHSGRADVWDNRRKAKAKMTYYINVYEIGLKGRQFLGSYSKVSIPNRYALYRLRITPKAGCTIQDVMGWRHG